MIPDYGHCKDVLQLNGLITVCDVVIGHGNVSQLVRLQNHESRIILDIFKSGLAPPYLSHILHNVSDVNTYQIRSSIKGNISVANF